MEKYLHLLMPTFEHPANHGSIVNMHRKVAAFLSPSYKAGLSCKRKPLRNQWIKWRCGCFLFDGVIVMNSGAAVDESTIGCSSKILHVFSIMFTWYGRLSLFFVLLVGNEFFRFSVFLYCLCVYSCVIYSAVEIYQSHMMRRNNISK